MTDDAGRVPGDSTEQARRLLAVATGALLVFTVVHFGRAWYTGGNLGQSSGVVIGQAMDLAAGVFYRPLVSDYGYGGTRYMPLPFVVIAPFIRAGLDPINTAIAITLLADVLLLSGIYVLLRRLGVDRSLAWTGAVLVLSAGCGQYAATTVRGDLLPAALNVWGLAFAVGEGRRARPVLAGVFFVLAFTGKVVALYGAAACGLAMLLSGRWKDAVKLAGVVAVGMVVSVGLVNWASGGRFMENMRACASGGTTWAWVREFYWRRLWGSGLGLDWTAMAWVGLAGLSVLRMRVGELRRAPFWALVITGVVTFGLFASPGVAYNVFLDLVVVSVVFIILQIAAGRVPYVAGVVVLSVVMVVAIPYLVWKHGDKGMGRARAEATVLAIGRGPGPILCKPPMLAVYAGESPHVLDPWMFRHLAQRDEFEARLHGELKAGHFRAVVVDDLGSEKAEEGAENQFGWAFVGAMEEGYAEAARVMAGKKTIGVVWKPKSQVQGGRVQVVKTPVQWTWWRWWRGVKRRFSS